MPGPEVHNEAQEKAPEKTEAQLRAEVKEAFDDTVFTIDEDFMDELVQDSGKHHQVTFDLNLIKYEQQVYRNESLVPRIMDNREAALKLLSPEEAATVRQVIDRVDPQTGKPDTGFSMEINKDNYEQLETIYQTLSKLSSLSLTVYEKDASPYGELFSDMQELGKRMDGMSPKQAAHFLHEYRRAVKTIGTSEHKDAPGFQPAMQAAAKLALNNPESAVSEFRTSESNFNTSRLASLDERMRHALDDLP